MSEPEPITLSGVPETLLIPLYIRALESQHPNPMMKDEKAVALVAQIAADNSMRPSLDRVRRIPMMEVHKVTRIMLTREMDRYTRDFLNSHPEAVVVHIGCGLDSRFERLAAGGRVEWYDLDLPDVISLRRKLIGGEGPALPQRGAARTEVEEKRYHLLGCSVLEDAWLEAVSAHRGRPFLFLAEGVFMYFEGAQVKRLVLTLCDRFPGAELVFDGWTSLWIRLGNRILSRSGSQFTGLMRWGFRRSQEIEAWGAVRLLDEWGYFDRPEPRLNPFRWMAPIYRLLKPMRIFHFRLGKATGTLQEAP